jgi:hypothetical protein
MALVGKYVSEFAEGAENVLEFGARFTSQSLSLRVKK